MNDKEFFENQIRSHLNKKKTKKDIAFIKDMSNGFIFASPVRNNKMFNPINTLSEIDKAKLNKDIKSMFKENHYNNIKTIDQTIMIQTLNKFKDNNVFCIYYKRSGKYKDFDSLIIRIANAFSHNQIIFIRDRILLWDSYGDKFKMVVYCNKVILEDIHHMIYKK